MSLHRRLKGLHKAVTPEVFLRTVAVIRGQHGGGLLGYATLSHTPWDAFAPDFAIGVNDWRARGTPPSLKVQAANTIAWLDGAPDPPFRFHRDLPDSSRYSEHINWIVRQIAPRVKDRRRMHKRNGAETGPGYFEPEGRSGLYSSAPRHQPYRILYEGRDALKRLSEGRFPKRPWHSPVTWSDIELAGKMVFLSQRLRHIIDWKEAHPDVELADFGMYGANEAANQWHAELVAEREATATREHPGVIERAWPDGWTAQSLITLEQLDAEGSAMGHCVGDASEYWIGVQGGDIAIVSLRDPQGDPHVTFELRLLEPEGAFELEKQCMMYADVAQAKGPGNKRPHPDHHRYVREYLEAIEAQQWGEAFITRKAPIDAALEVLTLPFWRDQPEGHPFSADEVRAQLEETVSTNHFHDLARVAIMLRQNWDAALWTWQAPWLHLKKVMGGDLADVFSKRGQNRLIAPLIEGRGRRRR